MTKLRQNYEIKTRESGLRFSSPSYCKESEIAYNETNDCVVRAMAAAFDITYNEAHDWCKTYFNREDRRGTRMTEWKLARVSRKFGKVITQIGERVEEGWRSRDITPRNYFMKKGVRTSYAMTTKSFVEKYSTGSYIILVSRHAFAIVEGVIIGNYDDSLSLKTRIESAFRIEGGSKLEIHCKNN